MHLPVSVQATQSTAHPARAKRDPLVAVTCIVLMLAVFGYAAESVHQYLAAAAAAASEGPRAGKLEELAYTNAEAAHVTVTNLNAFPVESCFRAVVTGRGGGRVESVPVCTGALKPRTTVVLVAPYRVDAVEQLCAGETERFGIRRIDWSKCSFTTEPVKD